VLDADASAIDWIRILKFKDYSQLADQQALAATHLPPVITENPDDRIIGTPAPAAATPPAKAPPASAPAATPAPKAAPVVPAPRAVAPPQKAPAPPTAGPAQ